LADEYKIVQDKIDKIGGFKFIIKGWSVTAVIDALAVGKTANLLTTLMISVGLAFMLFYFFRLEVKQERLSMILGERARKLEVISRRINRENNPILGVSLSVPYIAHEIALADYKPKKKQTQVVSRAWPAWWKMAKRADIHFYAMLVGLILLPFVPRYKEIKDRWIQRSTTSQSMPAANGPILGPAPK